jgi:hypothetical protein
MRGSERSAQLCAPHVAIIIAGAIVQAGQFESPKAISVDLARADAHTLRLFTLATFSDRFGLLR